MKQYNVTGMTCAACQARVEKAVSAVPGVSSCAVSLLTNSMGVDGTASDDAIIKAVTDAGYGASVKGIKKDTNNEDTLKDTETPRLRNRLIASLILLIPLMYVSMGHMMWNWPLPAFLDGNHVAMGIYEMLLAGLIMVINQRFFISGFKGLIHRSPNMDTLVALGASASFIYSTYALFAMTGAVVAGQEQMVMHYMDEFYFESAATILTLITVGKMLEARSKGKTTDALKGLMKLAPKTAVIVEDNVEKTVSIEDVKVGDHYIVKAGDSIPVDGIVLEGQGAVDESALTGESIPVEKTIGDNVSAATINQSGYMICEAVRVGEDTTLSKIIQMVSDAAATKAPIAKVADKVSGVFVPAVITIAVVTFIIWMLTGHEFGFSLARAISVLVISCPCALGLATPVAIMVGSGVGAKNGIMFKTAVSLEETGKVNIVCLDKTGTITHGEPVVTRIMPKAGLTEDKLLEYAYSLEIKSEHPLAKAIIKEGNKKGIKPLDIQDYENVTGLGLKASYNGKSIIGGNQSFIESQLGKSMPENILSASTEMANNGMTPLFFSYDNDILGVIAVADSIKEDSAAAIKEMRDMDIHVVMLTGDNDHTARAIGQQAGVDEVVAGILPEGKAKVIQELQKYGKVAMIGDGINDAPALTKADMGIAIGAGTDVAIDVADVVLIKSSLMDAVIAIRLSRCTLKNIYENLFWAFIYNIIGIPLAAGLWIPIFGWTLNPMFGAAAMSLSSFCVVSNALRLNVARIRDNKTCRKMKNAIESGRILLNSEVTNENGIAIDATECNKCNKDINTIKEDNTMEIIVKGMMCQHCEKNVKRVLEELDAIDEAIADHDKNLVMIKTNKDISEALLRATIEGEGYEYGGIKNA